MTLVLPDGPDPEFVLELDVSVLVSIESEPSNPPDIPPISPELSPEAVISPEVGESEPESDIMSPEDDEPELFSSPDPGISGTSPRPFESSVASEPSKVDDPPPRPGTPDDELLELFESSLGFLDPEEPVLSVGFSELSAPG